MSNELWAFASQALLTAGLAGLGGYFGSYLREKGKNLATKEDVAAITREVESVRAEISQSQSIASTKHQLKVQACRDALALMDAYLSHALKPPHRVAKQSATTEMARKCHSDLLLTCEHEATIRAFENVLFPDKSDVQNRPLEQLREFRRCVRIELGFGELHEATLGKDIAWLAHVICDPNP